MKGILVVFEGPDGFGKTTLSRKLASHLQSRGTQCTYVSFPGHEQGTLGKLIYELHHNPNDFGVEAVDSTSLQMLHVAAHIDTINRVIRPALNSGHVVIMDRYWWSTVIYGWLNKACKVSLKLLIQIELEHWAQSEPDLLFLLDRDSAPQSSDGAERRKLQSLYKRLHRQRIDKSVVKTINTDCSESESLQQILDHLAPLLDLGISGTCAASREAQQLSLIPPRATNAGGLFFSQLSPAVASPVYDTYWRFAAERQEIFFRRARGLPPPWSKDPILTEFKFTNAYRASDRVSQFLIKEVIYKGPQDTNEVFFRTILFKLFNKIETWELLQAQLGELRTTSFDIERYDAVLAAAMAEGTRIYSAAYIMPSGGRGAESRKHLHHLKLLKTMLEEEAPSRFSEMNSMLGAFELLRSYPMIGDFLAYQYVTDLNYSTVTNFSEMEFVIPGPGARDGIRKCFQDLGGLSEADIIRMIADRQEREFEQRGLQFRSLWGRALQLIDCQNLFCEVDKYARYAHPEIVGISGRTRIKQKFRSTGTDIQYWYPPKWGINDKVVAEQDKSHACI